MPGATMALVRSHKDLRVWQTAMDLAMQVFRITQRFPIEERFSLVDQIRRSSRAVAANITEAWRKRRYIAAFRLRINDAETEAAETQTHLEITLRCGYLEAAAAQSLESAYESLVVQLSLMHRDAERWCKGITDQ